MIDDRSIDNFPIEILAAYVDGELEPTTRFRVERWLAEHPEALTDLRDQEGLSPANEDYWQSVTPPLPSNETWNDTLAGIETGLTPRYSGTGVHLRGRLGYVGAAIALVGMAAALLIAVVAVDQDQKPMASAPVNLAPVAVQDDEEFIFKVATADDVELMEWPEEATDLLVVGRHPLNGVAVVFADSADVQVLNYGLDDQGEVADYQIMRGPDTPMFVAPPRKK